MQRLQTHDLPRFLSQLNVSRCGVFAELWSASPLIANADLNGPNLEKHSRHTGNRLHTRVTLLLIALPVTLASISLSALPRALVDLVRVPSKQLAVLGRRTTLLAPPHSRGWLRSCGYIMGRGGFGSGSLLGLK